jgi:hypothetical protein
MNLVLKINDVDRTDRVIMGSLQKSDVINEKVDNLRFSIRKYESSAFAPAVNDSVELLDTGVTIFKGVILSVSKSTEGHSVVLCEVDCVDNSREMDRTLVNEQFADTTGDAVIEALISDYAPSFTTNNVNAPFPVKSITFNRVTVSDAIQKLAQMSGYSWYVDYDNDVHFFEKNTETAPFNLTDTSENYIYDSLEVTEDISQLRNRVFIRGGEAEGDARTELFDGDGSKKFFKLANKFSGLPTVTVNGVAQSVGVDFLDNEDDFDVFWNFNEKYLKFKDSTIPAEGTDNISVTGIPLFPILVQVEDTDSINQYGLFEFSKTDKTIKSKREAFDFALAELEAYAEKISEGSFETYTPGLRSGQLINITSESRGISEDFLIQKVSFQMLSQDTAVYRVQLATLRTVSIIDFLISQLKQGSRTIEETQNEIIDKYGQATEEITIEESVVTSTSHNPQAETITIGESFTPQSLNYAVEFVLGEQAPSGVKRQFVLDSSPLA